MEENLKLGNQVKMINRQEYREESCDTVSTAESWVHLDFQLQSLALTGTIWRIWQQLRAEASMRHSDTYTKDGEYEIGEKRSQTTLRLDA